MGDVAGVEEEVGRGGQGVDLVDGELQGAGYVLVGGLVEADVAVADLDEAEEAAFASGAVMRGGPAAKSLEVGTPPAMVQRTPVPAQAMQVRKLRRSMPSSARTVGSVVVVEGLGSRAASCLWFM